MFVAAPRAPPCLADHRCRRALADRTAAPAIAHPMLGSRLLPWEYGVRNLLRRPSRTALTLVALTIVVLLVFVVVAFIQGLEASLVSSGNADVMLVYAQSAAESIEN